MQSTLQSVIRFVCVSVLLGLPVAGSAAMTERVSLTSAGMEGNGASFIEALSGTGQQVLLASGATNFVAPDANGFTDLFVRDRNSAQTTAVSVSAAGATAAANSSQGGISSDGRYVVFVSGASNIVAGDTNGVSDIFLRDRTTGQTMRISRGLNGAEANGASVDAAISADGRYMAFSSAASNLVAGDTNGVNDVFLYERSTGLIRRVSVGPGAAQANADSRRPALSVDGQFVAYDSAASNLVSGDGNGLTDVFVYDVGAGQTERVSVASAANGGAQGNGSSRLPSISASGRYVAFTSRATTLVPGDTNSVGDVFVRDRQTQQTARVSVSSAGMQGDEGSDFNSISGDGRYVAFISFATTLVGDDTNDKEDVFVHDRATGQTTRVSVSSSGAQGNSASDCPTLSSNGRYVGFCSAASNLVGGDTNNQFDVFVRGPLLPGLGLGVTASGGATDASFFGGATADGSMTFKSVFNTSETIDVLADFVVDTADAGAQGAIYVVVVYQNLLLYKSASGFQLWNGMLNTLQPVAAPRALNPFEHLEIVRGLSGIPGNFAVIVGYADAGGDIHFHPTPMAFSVAGP